MEYKHAKAIGKNGKKVEITLATGPVIIERGRVLLDKHGKDEFWKFPGGSYDTNDGLDFAGNAKKHAQAELGIELRIEDENPFTMVIEREHNGILEYVILVHYRARRIGEIKPRKNTRDYRWFDIDRLPKDSAPNIKPVIRYFKSR